MKRFIFSLLMFFGVGSLYGQEYTPPPNLFSDGLRFCEGTVAYQNKILVSNFGGDVLNPLNKDGKGYIMAIENNKIKPFIKNDGYLSAPKGMMVVDKHLFVADVGSVVVYDLTRLNDKPVVIDFPEGNLFVNDIIVVGDLLIVSVTDAGKLYGIDISNIDNLASAKPRLLGDVPGANGLALYENLIYIASYNPTGVPAKENVIYVADIMKPNDALKKLDISIPAGQYDGIAVSGDGKKLYFSAWSTSEVAYPAIYVCNLVSGTEARVIDMDIKFGGPADITIKGGNLWIPDLPNSRVFRFELQ